MRVIYNYISSDISFILYNHISANNYISSKTNYYTKTTDDIQMKLSVPIYKHNNKNNRNKTRNKLTSKNDQIQQILLNLATLLESRTFFLKKDDTKIAENVQYNQLVNFFMFFGTPLKGVTRTSN